MTKEEILERITTQRPNVVLGLPTTIHREVDPEKLAELLEEIMKNLRKIN